MSTTTEARESIKARTGVNTYYFGAKYEEQYQSGQPTKYISYYFQNGQRVAQRTYDGTTYEVLYYHTDHLGSAVRLTDTNGDPVQSIAYAPFGETVFFSGVTDPKFQYTGQELDTVSGLYYYGARYYSPEIGRFIQPDTILDGLNRYAYCWNNPMNYTDPTGNEFQNAPPAVTIGSDGTIIVGGTGARIHTSGEGGGTQNAGGDGASMNGSDSHPDYVDGNGDLLKYVSVERDNRIRYGQKPNMNYVNYGNAADYLAFHPGYHLPGSVGNINDAEVAAGRTPPNDGGELAGRGGGPNIEDLLETIIVSANTPGNVCTNVKDDVIEWWREQGWDMDLLASGTIVDMENRLKQAVIDGIIEDLGIGEPGDPTGGSKNAQDWANTLKPTFAVYSPEVAHIATILPDPGRDQSTINVRGPKCGGGNMRYAKDYISDVAAHFNWYMEQWDPVLYQQRPDLGNRKPHFYGFK